MSDFRPLELDPLHPKRHLRTLHTPFGPRAVYDSASFCTRCGSCQQACPTYVLTAEETFSPRGRNQAVRLAAEGKLNPAQNKELLSRLVNSCLLCGRCTQACAGKIPTAEHMLELRRTLNGRALPALLHTLLSWRSRRPGLFRFIVRAGLALRRAGAVRLLRLMGLTRLPGLTWINHADDILPARTPAFAKRLRQAQIPAAPQDPALIYLPSLEAEFLCRTLRRPSSKPPPQNAGRTSGRTRRAACLNTYTETYAKAAGWLKTSSAAASKRASSRCLPTAWTYTCFCAAPPSCLSGGRAGRKSARICRTRAFYHGLYA